MPDQVDHVLAAYEELTLTTRSSWGLMYCIRPEKAAEVKKAQLKLEIEINGLDLLSLTPINQIRLRRAEEDYLVRTDPKIERQRRIMGGREV